MRPLASIPRALLIVLATLFAAATILYSAIWMYYIRWEPQAQLGIDYEYSLPANSLRITRVYEGTGADRVGLRLDDRIVAINGRRLDTPNPLYDAVLRGQPGDVVSLTVERPGRAAPLTLQAVLRPRPREERKLPLARTVAVELLRSYPVLFLEVGLVVLFLRLQDRNAWLLALMFAGFIAGAPFPEAATHPSLRGFALAYKVTFEGLWAALFYYFFAVFPVPSPIDRRLPWLKSVLLVAAAAVAVPLGLWALLAGSSQPLLRFLDRVGERVTLSLVLGYCFAAFVLGLVSLVWTSLRAPSAAARRKTRVIVWGSVVGFTPALLLWAAAIYTQKNPYEFPFWVWAPCVLALFLLPLSFAYAVVKHRVLEIPLFLKRSARYLLVQRGFTLLLLLLGAAATVLVADLVSTHWLSRPGGLTPPGVAIGVALGAVLVWGGTHIQQRVTQRIDRAFFRSAYDARHILEELSEKTRTASNRQELSALLQQHLIQALQPATLVVYLETGEGNLVAEHGRVLAGLETIPADCALVQEVARRSQPWILPPPGAPDAPDFSPLAPLNPECLVPIQARNARLIGLIVLGPRLSEEPYSREDKRLLASVASQAGIALESLRLAEQMAERMEAERRAAREMDIAREVQANLFPRYAPRLQTLEYAGDCIQTRAVGGDYYDFLDLGPGRVGLVLADIVGKGISAALLMASLQAHLRGQSVVAPDDLPRLLKAVNRLLYKSTAPHHYATLFYGHYDDATRCLRYANCGHNPPVLLRDDGRVEHLTATAMVLGLFEEWDCSVEEVQLAPGDTLVIFTDGITEAMSDEGEEFGNARLLDTLRAHRHRAVPELLRAIVTTVQNFSGREQEDDLTLLVARAR